MKIGRNSPCVCGSGKKYKLCCGLKAGRRSSKTRMLLIFGALIVVVLILIGKIYFPPQPPGPAPPGKVWSAEHGHWHDAPSSQPSGTPAGSASK